MVEFLKTDAPCALMMEDDCDISTASYWPFEWKNFYNTNNDELEISNYYYDLEDLDKKFEKRDLIFISLESFERT